MHSTKPLQASVGTLPDLSGGQYVFEASERSYCLRYSVLVMVLSALQTDRRSRAVVRTQVIIIIVFVLCGIGHHHTPRCV